MYQCNVVNTILHHSYLHILTVSRPNNADLLVSSCRYRQLARRLRLEVIEQDRFNLVELPVVFDETMGIIIMHYPPMSTRSEGQSPT